jgi:hypothetical protein
MRPGLFAGAAAHVAAPVARPIQERAIVGASATVYNLTVSHTQGAVAGTGLSVPLTNPSAGASLDLGWKLRDRGENEINGGVSVGLSRHTAVTITNDAVYLNVGIGTPTSPIIPSVDLPEPQTRPRDEIPAVLPDKTAVSTSRP